MAADLAGVRSQQLALKRRLTKQQKSFFSATWGDKFQAPPIALPLSPALPPVLENDGSGSFCVQPQIDRCKQTSDSKSLSETSRSSAAAGPRC